MGRQCTKSSQYQMKNLTHPSKGPKFPKVTINKKNESSYGVILSSSLGAASKRDHGEIKSQFQLIPLTKANNITINLSISPTKPASVSKQSVKVESEVLVPKIVHEKSDTVQLVSNNQSFTCVLSAIATTSEVNINVNFKLHGSDVTEKPILSLYSDYSASPYNILATAMGQQLHIQQQHVHSGNATNVKFVCLNGVLALEWAMFINAPHHQRDNGYIVAETDSFPPSAVNGSPRSPVRFTPVSQFGPTVSTVGDLPSGKSVLSPLPPQSSSPPLMSAGLLTATPPQGILSPSAQQQTSPRRRSQSSQEARSFARPLSTNASVSDGDISSHHHHLSSLRQPSVPQSHDLLKAALTRPLNSVSNIDERSAHVNRSRHSQSEDVTVSTRNHPISAAPPREHSFSADGGAGASSFGTLTESNLHHMNAAAFARDVNPLVSSRGGSLVEQWTEDINKIRAEIAHTETQYKHEEAAICAAEEASLKDSVNTVYSSLLNQGLLPSELAAEQIKVQTWEGVQRKKNGRKSVQRLAIIAEELSSMRVEGEELIRRLRADIDREEAREASQKAEQLDSYTKILEQNSAAIAANKQRVQDESDRLRAEMLIAEKRVKDEALRRNQDEEAKLQQTVGAVYSSLLGNQELSSADLLLEQDKVHVWENIQRAKLAKSVKARRKATGKEVARVLDLGRESIKQLMMAAEEQNKQLMMEIQNAEQRHQQQQNQIPNESQEAVVARMEEDLVDDVFKYRTYSDMPTVDGRLLNLPASSSGSVLSAAHTASSAPALQVGHQSTSAADQEISQREVFADKLRAAIEAVQRETTAQEQRMVQEENSLCVEEASGLTASVSAVYASLLHQGLTSEQLLGEQEKVAVWEAIQRKKQQKQAVRRKAALKTRLQDLRQVGEDKVLALNLELNRLIARQSTAGSALTLAALDSMTATPFGHNSDDSPLERRIKDYSRVQFELHSSAQRELHDKQQALQQQIADRKAAILFEEEQRLEAIKSEGQRKERVELERLESLRVAAEQQREGAERCLMEGADEEDQRRTKAERALTLEKLRLHQARTAGLARKVCHRMATRLQMCCRNYVSRLRLHAHATRIQRRVRGHLVTRRIARHFREAISQIENQSARIITLAVRSFVERQKARFQGWDILHELVVVSVLRFNLQRREILLLSCRIAANRRKKGLIVLSRQRREEERKSREKVKDEDMQKLSKKLSKSVVDNT